MEDKILDMIINIAEAEDEESVIRGDLDINLFETGLLDSMGYTELLVDIEDKFGIELSPTEVSREMVDTPRKIIELIKSRS